MKKRIISQILSIALLISLSTTLFPAAAAPAADGVFRELSGNDNILWKMTTDGQLEIILKDANESSEWPANWGPNSAPWYHLRDGIKIIELGVGVTEIGNYAFNGASSLTNVAQIRTNPTDPGITRIGDFAFNRCGNLLEIRGISDIVHIGEYAFNGCVNLRGIDTAKAAEIGRYAFNGCVSLLDLTLGNVTQIGDYAFNGCVNLESIVLPERMQHVGVGLFAGCRSLASIIILQGSGIGHMDIAFVNDVLLCTEYDANSGTFGARILKAKAGLPEGYGIIPYLTVAYPDGTTSSFTVTSIDVEAFAYQNNLTQITIPPAVSKIGLNAFSWSSNLKEARFTGHAPSIPQIPNAAQNARIFENVADGFVIYYDYYPTTTSTGWPIPPASIWRGYTALANNSFVLIEPSTPSIPHSPVVTIVEQGKTVQLRATVYPLNAAQDVTWESSDPTVATVSNNGVVHGISPGEAVITASVIVAGGVVSSAHRLVQVVDRVIPVTAVSLDKTQMTLIAYPDEPPVPPETSIEILTAIVHPSNAAPAPDLIWRSSNTNVAYVDIPNPRDEPHIARIIAVSPGTATITVTARTANGDITSVPTTVTVIPEPTDPSVFVPVTNITLTPTVPSLPMGGKIDLNEISAVWPENATKDKVTSWRYIEELSTLDGVEANINVILDNGVLTVPWGQTGTVVVEAVVSKGRSDITWGYEEDFDYTKMFVINVVPFEPVTSIKDVPAIAHTGIPLQLKGTVLPIDRPIEWRIKEAGDTGAYIDPVSGMFVAQRVGKVEVTAIVKNGVWVPFESQEGGLLADYEETFTIQVIPYNPKPFTLRSDPGGRVSVEGSQAISGEIERSKAVSEVFEIAAYPNTGYIFAGWHTSNGGTFADANSATTEFTMPDNEVTVTAFFSYVGVTDGWTGGIVIVPTPGHYFTNGNRYVEGSQIEFAHVTQRDFQLFSHVTLNGSTLTRGGHYDAERTGAHTKVTLVNGYLDTLSQGSHTLMIYFNDKVTVTASFTVVRTGGTGANMPTYTAQIYDDVRTVDWFFSEVAFVSERGWMTSSPSDPRLFRPNASATQGEVADAIYRMSGSPSVRSSQGRTLYGREAALEWALQNSITPVGGSYSVDSPITRQDLVQIISRLVSANQMTYPVVRGAPSFTDEWSIAASLRGAVTSLYRAGIIDGRTATTFVPQGNVTRAELAAILTRFTNAMN